MFGHDGTTPVLRIGCTLILPLMLAGCAGELSVLAPEGPAAAQVAELWWVMLAGAVLIFAGVMALALYAFKPTRGAGPSPKLLLIGGGLIFPVVTMIALLIWALMRGEQLVARENSEFLTLNAHSAQWSWSFSYPAGETTEGVLHVPAGEPFLVRITSEDVIHSFWVPRLGGKMDAVPGRTNLLVLRADRPGIYRGICAEYCGIGHTQMVFEVHAHPRDIYPGILAEAASGRIPSEMIIPREPPASDEIGETVRRFIRPEESQ
ncbi:MAG: cytochrome c oxidase subunit II [Hyphomonas sp.]